MMRLLLAILLSASALLAPVSAKAASAELRPFGVAESLGYEPGDSLLVIAADVESLPDYAFAGCRGLRRVVFEAGSRCTAIGECAFAEARDLQEISLPESLVSIGEGAFRECASLQLLALPQGVTIVPKEMCLRCESLEEIDFTAALTEIGSFAFTGCAELRRLVLPSLLRSIGSNAFGGCRRIKEVIVPDNVRQLESYIFAGCEALEWAVLPGRHDLLGELIFADTPSLREITINSTIPPEFDCDSSLFEPGDTAAWQRCTLRVPAASIPAYTEAPGWQLFHHIIAIP